MNKYVSAFQNTVPDPEVKLNNPYAQDSSRMRRGKQSHQSQKYPCKKWNPMNPNPHSKVAPTHTLSCVSKAWKVRSFITRTR
jgi:hypothetical protein